MFSSADPHPATRVAVRQPALPLKSSGTEPDTSRQPGTGWLAATRLWFGRYWSILQVLGILTASFLLLRIVLLLSFVGLRSVSMTDLGRLMLVGLRFDLLVGLCYVLPQFVHMTVVGNGRIAGRTSRLFLEAGWLVGFLLLPFLCFVEFIFFSEFQSRLNYIAFEYLVYPTEVCCNIWQSYPTGQLLVLVGAIGGSLYFGFRQSFARQSMLPVSWRRRYGLLAGMLAAITGLWSSTGMHDVDITQNRVANECAGNGLYSFVFHAWTCHFDYNDWYLTLDHERAFSRVRRRLARTASCFHNDSPNPLDRTIAAARRRRNYNVVLILEESFGADCVGALGDKRGWTPHFDALSRQGLLFDNFYATGNRTARALEAVLTSLPPIPTESILKRDHSDRVYTLAHVLAGRGYERLFMTGGRGGFDGVRSFMTANGFNRFVEQKDFDHPVFCNAWGVSDEDLFQRAIQEFDQLHDRGRPFFAVLLTVSNHRPYTFPAGRIPQTKPSRQNAVRYADWALGQFFDCARRHPFFRDTLFIVMGDHGARVYGSQMFPMRSYRIPFLMLFPNDEAAATRCHTLACSLDVAPTIMAALGGSYRSVFFGRDALSLPQSDGYALMQHNHDVALLNARKQMVVLGTQKAVRQYELDGRTFELTQVARPDPEMVGDAAAFFQLANWLYYNECCFPARAWDCRSQPCARSPLL